MYHPPKPTPPDTTDADQVPEFIELKNVGTGALNLLGFRFTNGIEFTFYGDELDHDLWRLPPTSWS